MPTRRIDDEKTWTPASVKPCQHPEHVPPGMIVLEPGRYEHTCPGCGRVIYFTVPERPRLEQPPEGFSHGRWSTQFGAWARGKLVSK